LRRGRTGGAEPGAGRQADALAVLGLQADEALARIAPPPIDLTKPITTDAVIAAAKDDALR